MGVGEREKRLKNRLKVTFDGEDNKEMDNGKVLMKDRREKQIGKKEKKSWKSMKMIKEKNKKK